MPGIEVSSIRKSFGATEALRGVSFRVAPGEIYGLLGPNGAGKTTVTPTGWAMEAVNSMLAFGAGAAEVAPYAAAFGVVFLVSLTLAARRLRP